MRNRILAAIVSTVALTVSGTSSGQDFNRYFDRAREACAPQVHSAFQLLHGLCTAAAVVDLAVDVENPSCTIAQQMVVTYLKACMENAAALIDAGEPVELPPFPDLGMNILATLEDREAGLPPEAPRSWPGAELMLPLDVYEPWVAQRRLEGLMPTIEHLARMAGTTIGVSPTDGETGSSSSSASGGDAEEATAVGPASAPTVPGGQ